MQLAIYSVTALDDSADAIALVQRINELIAKNKWSLDRERVQAVLDEEASAQMQARFGLKVISAEFDMEHDE